MDVDSTYLQSQTELLREIRNELQASRSMQAGGSAGGGISSGAARPGHTFVAAQSMADRTLLGQWNSLGWSNAYRSSYQSTFGGDLAAMVGFNRAPETLTQGEFQEIAGHSLVARASQGLTSIIAPGYAARTNELAHEIHQNSSRFIRFGNSSAGALGTGLDFGASKSLSRQMQTMALGDLRMNGQDYSMMTSLGMQSGQFDNVGGADDFMKKVKEMASATADLTRALHMSVQEVGTAMGNLRQMGVSNVNQQRSVMMQVGGAAMVAGMSSPEMMQLAGGVAQTGLQLGLNAETTMPAAAQQAAVIRSMSQSGLISAQVMAMGGGTAAVTNNIMNATMGFAGSMGGYLSMMGGGSRAGANSFDAILGGIGATGMGTFNGAMTMDLDRVDRMSKMSPDQMNMLMRNQFESTIRLSGISDMTSHVAEGMAFQLARGSGMDEAASRIYSKSNFTVAGRRAADHARQQTHMAREGQELKVGNDLLSANESFAGQVRRTIQRFEQDTSTGFNTITGVIDRAMGANAGADFEVGVSREILSGAGRIDASTFSDIMNASPTERAQHANVSSLRIRAPHEGFGSAGLAAGGAGIAAGMALVSNPVGWTAAALGLGVYSAGSALGVFDSTDQTFTGNEAQGMLDTQKMIMRGSGTDAAKLIASNGIKGKAFERLTAKHDRTKMTGSELQEINLLIKQVAAENKDSGISEQDIMNASIAMGVSYGTADIMSVSTHGGSAAGMSEIKDYLSGFDSGSVNGLQTAEGSAAAAKFFRAAATGTLDQLDLATHATFSSKMGHKGYDKLRANIDADVTTEAGKAKLQQIANGFEANSKNVGNTHFNRAMSAAQKVAEDYLSSSGLSPEDMSSVKKDIEATKGDGQAVLRLLDNGKFADLARGDKLGQAFKDAISVRDDTELENRSASNIADMYHLGDPTQLEKFMADPKNKPNLRKFVEASVLTGGTIEKDNGESSAARVANTLKLAADTLNNINSKLDLTSSTTKTAEGQ